MSPLDTDAIAQRLKAATPGPWTSDQFGEIAHKEMAIGRVFLADDFPCLDPEDDEDLARLEAEFAANAVLVAAAPGDIAALLAEVARLQTELIATRTALLPMVKGTHWINDEDVARARAVLGVSRLTEEPK